MREGAKPGHLPATAGLTAVVFALARFGRAALSAATVAAYIGAAYFFTSSTSFANPAVTIARVHRHLRRDRLASVLPYLPARTGGAALGAATVRILYPHVAEAADSVVVPHHGDRLALACR